MTPPTPLFPFLFLFLVLFIILPPPTTSSSSPPLGPTCNSNLTLYPCRSFAVVRATPALLSIPDIADLFSVSRLAIAKASNLSVSSPLRPDQPVLVPLTCSCDSNHSYAVVPYEIKRGDTFYVVSTLLFQNLTTYQAVMLVNPELVPENLDIGVVPRFPIFCGCAPESVVVTYAMRPPETVESVAKSFGVNSKDVNDGGTKVKSYSPIYVPVKGDNSPFGFSAPISLKAFVTKQANESSIFNSPPFVTTPTGKDKKRGNKIVLVLGAMVGILAALVVPLIVLVVIKQRRGWSESGRKNKAPRSDANLTADIYECLDKYRVFRMDEIRAATSDFDKSCLVGGSVYKGWWNGNAYAIKRMKWDAGQELRILQKVNHTNLVKLEGFCIDPEDSTNYIVYEYVENGSLHTWLHQRRPTKPSNLDWKKRLNIALDIANGLQYIHEHTFPTVVHKDIRTSNILLDANLRPKIANFGLAQSGCNAMTTNIVGTQGYAAPEYLLDGIVTTKMDVFAYGVVLLELLSGREAVGDDGRLLWTDAETVFGGTGLVGDEKLKGWLDGNLVDQSWHLESVLSVLRVARACVGREPGKRPSMVDIVYTLSKADESFASDYSGDGASAYSDVVAR